MSKQKLTRGHILRSAEEISHVLRQKPQVTQHFSFHTDLSSSREHARLGLAIPKKLARRAIDRNKIKRLIREAFRLAAPEIENKDLVVKLRTAIGKKTRGRLRENERRELRQQIGSQLND